MSTLEQLRKLLEQASPQPWQALKDSYGVDRIWDAEADHDVACCVGDRSLPSETCETNEQLIVAAVNALPKLLACAEALKQWEHWYSVDSEEYNRDNAREAGRAALAALEGEGRG